MVHPVMRCGSQFSILCALLLTGLCATCTAGAVPREMDSAAKVVPVQIGTAAATAESSTPGAAGLAPPWPGDTALGLPRQTTAESVITCSGDVYYLASANATPDFFTQQMALRAGAHGVSWAIYGFGGVAADGGPFALEVELASPLPDAYWVGVADYGRQGWQWLELTVPTGADYAGIPVEWLPVSGSGMVFAAVVVWDGQAATIRNVSLHLNVDAPPPADLTASDGVSGSTVYLNWTDPADSFPGLDYEAVQLERAESIAGPYDVLQLLPPGTTTWDDTHDGSANVLPYNTPVYYRASTVVAGTPGPTGALESGYRRLADVTGFTASMDLPDRIELAWNLVESADGYLVEYRANGGGDPLDWEELAFTPGSNFAHSAASPPGGHCAEKQLYEYRIQAQYLGDSSLDYGEAFGLRDGAPVAVINASPLTGYPPLRVDFGNLSSYDSGGGSIIWSDWDFDGDGSWDLSQNGIGSGYNTYGSFGEFNLTVEVTDDEGDQDQAVQPISIPGWIHTWGSPEYERADSLGVDAQGNVFVGGDYIVNSDSYIALAKYNTNSNRVWLYCWAFGGSTENSLDELVLDAAGNIYLVGEIEDTTYDVLICKVLPTGALDWAVTWDGGGLDYATGLAWDSGGNLVVSGATNSFGGWEEALILRFDTAGNLLWSKTWAFSGSSNESARRVAVAPTGGNIHLAIDLINPGAYGAGLVVLDDEANLLLQKGWWPSAVMLSTADITVDNAGSSYFCGMHMTAGLDDAFIMKFDAAGNLAWQKSWDAGLGDAMSDEAMALCLDEGLLQVVGDAEDSSGTAADLLWLTFDSTGGLLSERIWGTVGVSESARDIHRSADGALCFAGYAPDTAGSWSNITGSLSDLTGTVTTLTGVISDVSGTVSYPMHGFVEINPIFDDTGGGMTDVLIAKLGPLG